jgi:hypothetical protein
MPNSFYRRSAAALAMVCALMPLHAARAATYARIRFVAESGGDYSSIQTAYNALSSWCPNPSANEHCLIKIMPGQYAGFSTNGNLPGYVDIEGSGPGTTVINTPIGLNTSNTEIRSLAVQTVNQLSGVSVNNGNPGPTGLALRDLVIGTGNLFIYGSAAVTLDRVTVNTSYGAGSLYSQMYAVYSQSSNVTATNCSFTVTPTWGSGATGIVNNVGSLVLRNSTAQATDPTGTYGTSALGTWGSGTTHATGSQLVVSSYGTAVYNEGTTFVDGCQVSGGTSGGGVAISTGAIYFGASRLGGNPPTGTFQCVGSYNQNYLPLGANCQ